MQLGRFVDKLEEANGALKRCLTTVLQTLFSTVTYETKALKTAIFDTFKELAEYILVIAKRKKPFLFT